MLWIINIEPLLKNFSIRAFHVYFRQGYHIKQFAMDMQHRRKQCYYSTFFSTFLYFSLLKD